MAPQMMPHAAPGNQKQTAVRNLHKLDSARVGAGTKSNGDATRAKEAERLKHEAKRKAKQATKETERRKHTGKKGKEVATPKRKTEEEEATSAKEFGKPSGKLHLTVGSRIRVIRQQGVRKHPKKGSDQIYVITTGDVVIVEETKFDENGIQRLRISLDLEAKENDHHATKHKSHSGWIRALDSHGLYVGAMRPT